jgi:NADPH:quinone reductase-like Zn-dependent oxidoreductase
MLAETMRAVRYHAHGAPDTLEVEEVPRPVPQAGEVLVRVHAAGVNPLDWKIRQGWWRDSLPRTLPAIPGIDLAGVVAAIGPEVTTLQVGQAVYGSNQAFLGNGTGTYAEYAIAPARWQAPKPRNLSFDQAATVPTGAGTAWSGLFEVGKLQAGQRLLVHGAAGGVGGYAVQLGRWTGAEVIGTASAGRAEFVRSLGAQTVVDYTTTAFERVVHDVDVVLDTIGGETQERSWQVLKPGGMLVAVAAVAEETARKHGVRTVEDMAREHGVRTGMPSWPPSADVLGRLGELIESRALVALLGPVFPLVEARQAHALSETGHGQGRIILHVAD